MENDRNTTIQDLRDAVNQFRDERDWKQFHTPKDLALAMLIEAGELGEKFLWKQDAEIAQQLQDPQKRQGIQDELADIIKYALSFANAIDMDIASSCAKKMEHDAAKYPVGKARGSAKKYNEL
ncbi:MAG: hypothetical protein RL141_255 [Candidatus Parcubacteria bacterium]|jgi:NTP pyrophosphatase (non-canonical NTP hydrolase)